jgi:IgGFc binding protein
MAWLKMGRGCLAFGAVLGLVAACSAGKGSQISDDDGGTGNAGSGAGLGEGGTMLGTGGGGGGGFIGDPKTCEQAAQSASYIGCDFWPTVSPNAVWSIFDYAVVIANTGDNVVDVNVSRGGNPVATAQIQPNSLETVYLPWVTELKGPDADAFGVPSPVTSSVRSNGGAYHLTTTFPVTVYQFSALQYQPVGGPPGKNWAACPGAATVGCFSYSNDASLLIPSTAMTTNYRVMGHAGFALAGVPSYIVVTATQDGTDVNMSLSPNGGVAPGGGISAAPPGGSAQVSLDAGDAFVFLGGDAAADLSGSLVTANKPIQVISGLACVNVPDQAAACDHVEETVFPAETLGQRYVVNRPTGPLGAAVGHQVVLYGNFDNNALSYPNGMPPGAPSTLSAGQVVNLGIVNMDFEIEGTQSFGVGSFEQGGSVVDPNAGIGAQKGDPAFSMSTAVEQYRDKYVFLAPTDYDVNFVDIVRPASAAITLDGQPLSGAQTPLGGFVIERVTLTAATGGVHVLEGDQPFGIQVTGYGSYTSYYYPGGLNLGEIAPVPPQ